MNYENIDTGCIDLESLPWVPFTPYSPDVMLKYVKFNPVNGEMIVFLKAPGNMEMPRHHHSGTVIVYTLTGQWKYKEHNWIAKPNTVVYETAASVHTPQAMGTEEVLALNIIVGDLVYLDADDKVLAIENWKTGMQRYLAYCKDNGIEPQDLTAFNG